MARKIKAFDFIIPQTTDGLGEAELKAIEGQKFIDIGIPKNLPNTRYNIYKMHGKVKENKLEGDDGIINFKLRLWYNGEYGHALKADSRDFWYVTSVLREVFDKGHYIDFTTSSGSTYRIEPSRMSKEEFLEARAEKAAK